MPRLVVIGIQARSGSTRLPRKAFERIGGRPMLDHVIEASKRAAKYINQHGEDSRCRVAIVTPSDDPIVRAFSNTCDVLEGPEFDVLARYNILIQTYKPEFVVRVTGDCPMLPPYVISKLIRLAMVYNYDYVSNVDERFRTAMDGSDCEVLSAKALSWCHEMATRPEDREHVTTFFRRNQPDWARVGHVGSYFDHSSIKLSVDTPQDLDAVRKAYDEAETKWKSAVQAFGQTHCHRI
jgi:spore coat polysaccharide biosynthesis protein SpsF (cytidylyltransferase family)